MAFEFLNLLPGWETVLFFSLLTIFILVSAIIVFRVLRNSRWPYTWVLTKDEGDRSVIERKGRCRRIGFGDMGEEVMQIKETKKLKFHTGQTIGNKQYAWSRHGSLWYPTILERFDMRLKKIGLMPTHTSVQLAMSSMRKGIDKRYEQKDKWAKLMPVLFMGSLILSLGIVGWTVWYSSNSNVKQASINAEGSKTINVGVEKMASAIDKLDILISRLDSKTGVQTNQTIIGGSGLIVG